MQSLFRKNSVMGDPSFFFFFFFWFLLLLFSLSDVAPSEADALSELCLLRGRYGETA